MPSSVPLTTLPRRLLARPNARRLTGGLSSSIRRSNNAHAFSLLHGRKDGKYVSSKLPAAVIKAARPPTTSQSITLVPSTIQRRTYAELKPAGGKTEADLIVEELQELYDNAKDEFEIAVDSTNSATIYAASDRASARELLDQLIYVYTVYTEMTRAPAAGLPTGSVQVEETVSPNPKQVNADRLDPSAADAENPAAQVGLKDEYTAVAAPNYHPEYIKPEVKEEVKKRVGQRIRELKSAMERLEDMAGHES